MTKAAHLPSCTSGELKSLLRTHHMTPIQFAADIGVAPGTVYRWLSDEMPVSGPNRILLQLWLARLNLKVDQPMEQPPRLRLVQPDEALTTTQEETVMTREPLMPDTLRHWAMAEDPFDVPVQAESAWMGGALATTFERMREAIRTRSILVVAAEPGAGKSTILRRLVKSMAASRGVRLLRPTCLDRRQLTPAVLAQALSRDLTGSSMGSATTEARSAAIVDALTEQAERRIAVALIIDEAHELPAATLLYIKRLWDGDAGVRPMAVILVGQVPLARRLQTDTALRELAMRTQVLELPGLNGTLVGEYLGWRLALVNQRTTVFEAGALDALATRSRGSILALHCLASRTLAYTASVGDRMVTAAHVGRV